MMIEVNGWFNTRAPNSAGYVLPVGVINASIKKSFLKDHLTASISANNILNSMKWRWNVAHFDESQVGSWQEINRVFMFTLTYKFGSGNGNSEHKTKEGNDRLGGGGGRG